jgi:acetate kinase
VKSSATILVINAGSSSIKFAVYRSDLSPRLRGQIDGIGNRPRLVAKSANNKPLIERNWDSGNALGPHELMAELMPWLAHHLGDDTTAAVGHRVAIGGLEHTGPCLVDDAELARLRARIPLAPLHQPRNLEPIETIRKLYPGLPQVACFDTAFHRTLPHVAETYGLPRHLKEAGARRYGFHGLSYEYIAGRLSDIDAKAASGRTIVAHLGSGASLCALLAGKSIATTMGFSPLSGLMMATRPGELDAGLMIWLLRERGMSIREVEHMLYHESGLKGVSAISGDMRALLTSPATGAREAVDVFVYRVCLELAAMCAALEGLDALVFTAGIGEHAPHIRQLICDRLRWLGLELDARANARGEQRINTPASVVSVLVVPTNEELMIARHTARIAETASDVAGYADPI